MSLEKSFNKMISKNNGGILLFLLAVVFLAILINDYSSNKSKYGEFMSGNRNYNKNTNNMNKNMMNNKPNQNGNTIRPSQGLGCNESFAKVSGITTTNQNVGKGCGNVPPPDPASLLPKNTNSNWSNLNAAGGNSLEGVNLLKAGHHIGIDTVGQSLRNANLQLRSEPANPQQNVGPWMNTTIEPDAMRVPLELGRPPQPPPN